MSTCYVGNLCDALLLAAGAGRNGGAYFVSDGVDRPHRELFEALLATRGVRTPDRELPFRLAWAGATMAEAAWPLLRPRGEPPLTRQMVRLVGRPFTIAIDCARRELGYEPRVGLTDGLAHMREPVRVSLTHAYTTRAAGDFRQGSDLRSGDFS